MKWLSRRWPRAFQLLRFGTLNINTREHWDAAWRRHGHDGFRATAHLRTVHDRVLAWLPAGATMLDVGCGRGELLQEAAACGCHVCGVDISSVAIAAVRHLGFDGRVASLPRIPYPSGGFDVVTCTETLEHVTDARRTVDEMARILRPRGRLIVSVPDGECDTESAHVHRFTEGRLRRVLGRRFTILELHRVVEQQQTTLLVLAEAI